MTEEEYFKSVRKAKELGYKKILDLKAYKGIVFIKNDLKWIHKIKDLKKKLGVYCEKKLKSMRYDVDAYYQHNPNHTKVSNNNVYATSHDYGFSLGDDYCNDRKQVLSELVLDYNDHNPEDLMEQFGININRFTLKKEKHPDISFDDEYLNDESYYDDEEEEDFEEENNDVEESEPKIYVWRAA